MGASPADAADLQKVRAKVLVEVQVKELIQVVNLEATIQAVQRRVKVLRKKAA